MKTITALFWLLPVLAVAQLGTGVETPDGTCGVDAGFTCTPTWGSCCGKNNVCGRSTTYCGTGCQPLFGNCAVAVPTATPVPTGPGSTSPDGSCSGANQYNCTGSTFGSCCSSNNFCGSTTAHCNAGCQTGFGTCSGASVGNVTIDGSCGANGKVCTGSTFGACCSSSGFCGDSSAFCDAGCQSGFGNCTAASNVSIDGSCSKNGKTCKGSPWGDCCSNFSFCGQTESFCGSGCQASFGTCSSTTNISTDGSCGKNGKTCKGSVFGDCCSTSGFCGSTDAFCGSGCQSSFGTCSSGSTLISTDGVCGSKNGKTCVGSGFGSCCSSSGNCGSTAASHCGQGCQKGSSSACLTSNIPSVDGSCGSKVGLTCAGGNFNGHCCSSSGFCGTSTAFCDSGCQKNFGKCS